MIAAKERGLTPTEQRLARRIHTQRVRLRQLEEFRGWAPDRWRRWMDLALRLGAENAELRKRLDLQKTRQE